MSVTVLGRPEVKTTTVILPHPMTISGGIAQDNGIRFDPKGLGEKYSSKSFVRGCALINLFVSTFGIEQLDPLKHSFYNFNRTPNLSLWYMLMETYPNLSDTSFTREFVYPSCRWQTGAECKQEEDATLISYIEHTAFHSFSFQEVADRVREMGY